MTRRYISPSEIASMDCWRSYNWKRQGIKSRRSPKALSFGSAWDAFMGEWFRPVGTLKDVGDGARDGRDTLTRFQQSIDAGMKVLDAEKEKANATFVQLYGDGDAEVEAEYQEHVELLRGMGTHFAEWFDEDVHGVCRAAQFKVDVPLRSAKGTRASTKYSLHGYIDRVMEINGELWIVDDKTTGLIDDSFHDDFENDLQMPLYAYAMELMGYNISGIAIFAAAKKVPAVPELRKTPVVLTKEDGSPVTEPIACQDCDGRAVMPSEDDFDVEVPCARCEGRGVEMFKTGPRAGTVKTKNVTRPALRSMLSESGSLNYTTNMTQFLNAIHRHGLDPQHYVRELEWLKEKDSSNFFGYAPIHVSQAMIDEAAEILRNAGPMLDKIPDVPMRSRFRCKRCTFQIACVERNEAARADIIKTFFTTREEREAERQKAESQNTNQTEEVPA